MTITQLTPVTFRRPRPNRRKRRPAADNVLGRIAGWVVLAISVGYVGYCVYLWVA